eukprot:4302547-Amphidinium_carterae.2
MSHDSLLFCRADARQVSRVNGTAVCFPHSKAAIRTRDGQILAKDELDRCKPFEREEWLRREEMQFGRSKKEAEQEWNRHACARDYDGFKGKLRVVLPVDAYYHRKKSNHIDAG